MSSVTSFIKQVPAASQYFSAASLANTNVYELIPLSSNVVGNYPPGYVQLVSAFSLPSGSVCRDMGKTIFSAIGAAGTDFGRFRQIQIIVPVPITAAQGYIGGLSGNTFGVIGTSITPDTRTGYFTVYIPVVTAGISVVAPTSTQAVLAGGQL
jgi:hypothetical protein